MEIKTGDSKFRLRVEQGKWQAHITETYYTYPRLAGFNSGFQL